MAMACLPDCPICCEPLTSNLEAPSTCGHVYHRKCLRRWFHTACGSSRWSCPLCRRTCTASEVVRLQFELATLREDTNICAIDGESPQALKMRLSMARKMVNEILNADATRQREHDALMGQVGTLQRHLDSHVKRASKAEALASQLRAQVIRLTSSRDRLSAELRGAEKELQKHASWKHYMIKASAMSQSRAVEYLQNQYGDDLAGALHMQHSTICELQRKNAELISSRRRRSKNLKEVIRRKKRLIERLRLTVDNLRSSAHPSVENQRTSRRSAFLDGSNSTTRSNVSSALCSASPQRMRTLAGPPTVYSSTRPIRTRSKKAKSAAAKGGLNKKLARGSKGAERRTSFGESEVAPQRVWPSYLASGGLKCLTVLVTAALFLFGVTRHPIAFQSRVSL